MPRPKTRVQLTGSPAFQAREGNTRANVIRAGKRSKGLTSKGRKKLRETNQRKPEQSPSLVKGKTGGSGSTTSDDSHTEERKPMFGAEFTHIEVEAIRELAKEQIRLMDQQDGLSSAEGLALSVYQDLLAKCEAALKL